MRIADQGSRPGSRRAARDQLTSIEQALIDHVVRGELLDLSGPDDAVEPISTRPWEESPSVRASVIREIFLGRLAQKADPHGLRLRGARIIGQIDLENVDSRIPLVLTDCLLEGGLLARDAHLPFVGIVRCRLENLSAPPLQADRLITTAGMSLSQILVSASTEHGAIRLLGAHIGGRLECIAADLYNSAGPAIDADGLEVDQDVFLTGRYIGTGASGAVRLSGAHIGGQLSCKDATIRNDDGPGLQADGLQVDQGMFLTQGCTIAGTGKEAAARLVDARVGGVLNCDGATLTNSGGPALHADRLKVDQGMFLTGQFSATGSDAVGTVRLSGAYVGGQLACDGATFRNETGTALHAARLRIDQNLLLRHGFTAIGAGDGVAIDLTGARVAGSLALDPDPQLKHLDRARNRIAVDGLTYSGVPSGIAPGGWLQLLREGTPRYAAQPYQQLASGHRAAGHDGEAKKVLIAQRRDQIRYALKANRSESAWGRLTGLTLGYGYQPWRALVLLLATAILAVCAAVQFGAHGALAHTSRMTDRGHPCDRIERVGVGLDLGLPLIKTGARDRCDLTNSRTGQVLAVSGWFLQVLAWAFATLFVAGFTGAVRKT